MYILYLIIILIVCILFLVNKKDGFTQNEFHLYVITLKQPNRLDNIKEQQSKIGRDIVMFEGVNGDELDVFNKDNTNVIINNTFYNNTKKKKRQLGCYLAHFNLYNKIKQDNLYGYTIIFEDDFEIIIDDFLNKVKKIIDSLNSNQIDFDVLFLGNYDYNNNHGNLIMDNIYQVGNGEELHGLQGYVVNNKNIDKIINVTSDISITIDDKIQQLADAKKLNVFSIYPYYVVQGKQPTYIAEPFNNYSFI